MTRDEMITFIQKNPNIKVSHFLFDSDEYIYQKDGNVYEEKGYLFEDWVSDRSNGLRMRIGGNWDDGWYVKDEHRNNYPLYNSEVKRCDDCSCSYEQCSCKTIDGTCVYE